MVFSQNHGRNGIHECTPYGETPSGTDCASHWALGKPTAKTTAHEIAAIARIRGCARSLAQMWSGPSSGAVSVR